MKVLALDIPVGSTIELADPDDTSAPVLRCVVLSIQHLGGTVILDGEFSEDMPSEFGDSAHWWADCIQLDNIETVKLITRGW